MSRASPTICCRCGARRLLLGQPLERVERSWRGIVMDTYALEKISGWTPELSPPPDSPLFKWRVLAGEPMLSRTKIVAAKAD